MSIGHKKTYKEIEIINQLRELTQWNGKILITRETKKVPFNFDQHLVMDTNKIRQRLGYTEEYSFEEGLKRTIEFQRNQKYYEQAN